MYPSLFNYVKMVAISSHDEGKASINEFKLEDNGADLDNGSWTANASSDDGKHSASLAIDGDSSTLWSLC